MRIFVLSLLFLAFVSSARAEEQAPQHAAVRLISPVIATGEAPVVPAALEVKLDKGWHAYWRTPGEAGLAPALDWTGSENLAKATVRWPHPRRFMTMDIQNFGFEDEVVFPLALAVNAPGQALALKLKLDLLICSDICLPETHDLSLALPAGPAAPSPDAGVYDAALKGLPQQKAGFFKSAWVDVDSSNINYLVVTVAPDSAPSRSADLFVEHESALSFGAPKITQGAEKGTYLISVPVRDADTTKEVTDKLGALPVTLTYVDGDMSLEGALVLSPKPARAPSPPPTVREKIAQDVDVLRLALLAFLGGLILNLMPCVLPVLSLKVLSVLSHGGKDSRRDIFLNFSASALGILTSFWLMAFSVVALKAAGEAAGWGVQFQHPAFIVFLLAVVLLFAANMWGIFEVPLPRFIARNIPARHEHEPTLAGHFLTGAFATLLATPCTAPFLGTAVGFALARDAREIFSIFTMIGLGLAFPYILLALSPALFRHMPKPGKWMTVLKKILALALLAVAGWLANVLVTITTTPTLDEGWTKFDPALIPSAVAEGKVVFVDVTADWCLTCKANKRLVLESADIEEALSAPNVLRLQADWTQRDPKIAEYLKTFGRYGIPFNVVYGPGSPEGMPLPELLTKKTVLSALDAAAGE